ncbi:hypothetical protein JCM13664_10010 [Methylothermus subterraneus]
MERFICIREKDDAVYVTLQGGRALSARKGSLLANLQALLTAGKPLVIDVQDAWWLADDLEREIDRLFYQCTEIGLSCKVLRRQR